MQPPIGPTIHLYFVYRALYTDVSKTTPSPYLFLQPFSKKVYLASYLVLTIILYVMGIHKRRHTPGANSLCVGSGTGGVYLFRGLLIVNVFSGGGGGYKNVQK